MPDKNEILRINNINKEYLSPDGKQKISVLKNISFSVKKGESIAITGPSGSGKSTLLNIIGALDRPDAGEVLLGNVKFSGLNEKQLAEIRNRKIGFIFQQHYLLPQCTVIENVLVPTMPYRHPEPEIQYANALSLLEIVGLKNRIDHRPAQLSGGEMQRAAVVRALINEPDILLADEPTGSLDNRNAEDLVKLLTDINKNRRQTLIMVTHSQVIAKKMKRVYVLHNNALKLAG